MHQRIGDLGAVLGDGAAADLGQFGVEKLDVERSVVGNDLGVVDEFEKLLCHLGKAGFVGQEFGGQPVHRSEEHTSELQSLMRISYAVFCLKKKKHTICR